MSWEAIPKTGFYVKRGDEPIVLTSTPNIAEKMRGSFAWAGTFLYYLEDAIFFSNKDFQEAILTSLSRSDASYYHSKDLHQGFRLLEDEEKEEHKIRRGMAGAKSIDLQSYVRAINAQITRLQQEDEIASAMASSIKEQIDLEVLNKILQDYGVKELPECLKNKD